MNDFRIDSDDCKLQNFLTLDQMNIELIERLQELIFESSNFNSNDILVRIKKDDPKCVELGSTNDILVKDIPTKIIRDQKSTIKETGLNPLCLVRYAIQLPENELGEVTPLVLHPLEVENKPFEESKLIFDDEEFFINPYIINHFKKENVSFEIKNLEEVIELVKEFNFSPLEIKIVGNFHHHRYLIIKELEELISKKELGSSTSELLGFPQSTKEEQLHLSDKELLFSDTDQHSVFNAVQSNNVVIQGPPGTGKSQTLTNLIAKLISSNNDLLIVSEKRVALEVLQQRLKDFNLDKLSYISSSGGNAKDFIQDLKDCWQFFEQNEFESVRNLHLSPQYIDNLGMTFDLLAEEQLIGGLSFGEFMEFKNSYKVDDVIYTSCDVNIPKLLEHKELLNSIFKMGLNKLIAQLKPRLFFQNGLINFDEKIANWQKQLNQIQTIENVQSWNDLHALMRKSSRLQVLNNEVVKEYRDLFIPNSRQQKKFLSLAKRYTKITSELKAIEQQTKNYKDINIIEARQLLNTFSNGSFIQKLKARKYWNQLGLPPEEVFSVSLPILEQKEALDKKLSKITIEFCDLNILNPEDHVVIGQTIKQFSSLEWEQIFTDEKSLNIQEILEHQLILSSLHGDLKSYFTLEPDDQLNDLFDNIIKSLPYFIEHHKELDGIPITLIRLLKECTSKKDLYCRIIYGHYVRFCDQYPKLSNFEMKDIGAKIDKILTEVEEEHQHFALEILAHKKQEFDYYHQLLHTPAQKLSAKEKSLKKKLRKGKSILVKEFAKTRSHPSVRDLFQSEALVWIQLLKPIWFSSPLELSKTFPLEQTIFDVCIFDEATQIPLQNGLGAIERSRRVVVAGDEHQMGPMRYFSKGSKDVIDLLHQASFYWKNIVLTHHYRSLHPELISFSNKHFYNNTLKVFPGTKLASPLYSHYIELGRFNDRKNIQEANAIAKDISKALKSNINFGVVAFSEEQLNCIKDQLSSGEISLINERIDQNKLFFKTLENVQGDECDHLFISFAYGYSNDGDFRMQFGPVNLESGRNRLNVLFTRAKKSIHFYHSVHADDFKISDNESVNLMRQWFDFIENNKEEHELINLHSGLQFDEAKNVLNISQINAAFDNVHELITFHHVMKERGWKLEYH